MSMGNPFTDESHELMTLDGHDCLSQDVIVRFREMEALGKDKYTKFVKDVLVERTLSIHEPTKCPCTI